MISYPPIENVVSSRQMQADVKIKDNTFNSEFNTIHSLVFYDA